MTAPRKYPQSHVKVLYGLAAGRCAFSACRREIILEGVANDEHKQIGKIAHIVGHSDSGPRGDSAFPREKLDTYENWVLLCPTCHDTVDIQPAQYTVGRLRTVKDEHEQWVRASLASEMSAVGFPELEVVAKAIASADTPTQDFSVTPPKDKMAKNGLTGQVHILLAMGLSKSKEVRAFIQGMVDVDSEFPERLKAGFVKEYERARGTGLSGDALFESMREFSSSGSRDFKRQAAGLAVLTYLFESCEVFEK